MCVISAEIIKKTSEITLIFKTFIYNLLAHVYFRSPKHGKKGKHKAKRTEKLKNKPLFRKHF